LGFERAQTGHDGYAKYQGHRGHDELNFRRCHIETSVLPTRQLLDLAGRDLTLDDLLANESDSKPFVHPMVHAIVLHFWLAYLHPFVDGNGRLARALFYWKLLRSGYDFAQYLSISGPIDRSRRAYYLAFAHSETDDGDLTYFVLHQLAVLRRAEKDLAEHLKQRTAQLRQLTAEAPGTEALNHRQQGALLYCARNPHLGVTVKGHASSHGVTYLTARKDLQRLEADGYMRRVRVGKTDKYLAVKRGEPGK
jgi:Fic family protein